MNGVHDMGGLECFGPINPEPNEPVFHEEWERRVLAATVAMGATGQWCIDEGRSARESITPSDYLSIGYYRIWLTALENLLLRFEMVTEEELKTGRAIEPPKQVQRILRAEEVDESLLRGWPADRPATTAAKFAVGDSVVVNNLHATGHTRLPGYIRGATGVIHKVHGCHVYPDSTAQRTGENPHWLYNVKFDADTLWGQARKQSAFVHVDCWEPYLDTLKD